MNWRAACTWMWTSCRRTETQEGVWGESMVAECCRLSSGNLHRVWYETQNQARNLPRSLCWVYDVDFLFMEGTKISTKNIPQQHCSLHAFWMVFVRLLLYDAMLYQNKKMKVYICTIKLSTYAMNVYTSTWTLQDCASKVYVYSTQGNTFYLLSSCFQKPCLTVCVFWCWKVRPRISKVNASFAFYSQSKVCIYSPRKRYLYTSEYYSMGVSAGTFRKQNWTDACKTLYSNLCASRKGTPHKRKMCSPPFKSDRKHTTHTKCTQGRSETVPLYNAMCGPHQRGPGRSRTSTEVYFMPAASKTTPHP